jgi:mevalonate kinase
MDTGRTGNHVEMRPVHRAKLGPCCRSNVLAWEEVAMDAMKSMQDQRKKELEKAMEEGRKKHLKMLRNVVQELTGESLSLSDEELSDLRFPPRK